MKALYLLLGLLLLTTISSAPPTPFLIGGWVIDSDGDQVNISNVTITNLNKSEVYTAETIADSNYYQHVPDNISEGDVLEFNTTDGTRYNITKHDVVTKDIWNGTIFPFNITLTEAGLTPTPQIIGYDPDSTVHDIGNATRTFNIMVDQVVNITWRINGTEVLNKTDVNESSYTNTSADIGLWNVSAIVSNGNKTAMQKWVWNVTTLLPPNITAFGPTSPVYDIRNATRTFNITIDQEVDVTWFIDGTDVFNESDVNESSYTNTSADIGLWNVSAIVSNGNKTAMQKWVWNVTTLLPPNILSFAPLSPVYDIRNATRTFNITIDQEVDVTWQINGLQSQTNESVTDASYTNTSADIGVWNISARVSNGNGTARQEWVWNVSTLLPPNITSFTPTSPVNDTRNATRTFNITVDQVVDVTWLINGLQTQTNGSVTNASYTNYSADIGVWNISARVSNGNGTAMQEWVWYVAPPSSATSQPAVPFVVCGWMNYEGGSGVYDDHTVNITNHNTGTVWQAETQAGCNYYELILDSEDVGAGNVFEFEIADGVGYNTTNHTITEVNLERGGIFDLNLTLPVLAPLVDVELTPDDDPAIPEVQVINEISTTNRTVTIIANVTDPDDYKNITNVIADITGAGIVEESPVSLTFVSNSSATTARYTGRFNMSDHPVGDYNVVVRAINTRGFAGTSSKSFTYLHETTTPLHLFPFIIYGLVSYDNGASCNSPFVVVTNLNTSEELIADNRTGEYFYQLVTSSAFVKAGDVLKINASKNGESVGNARHEVNQADIGNGVIKVDINEMDLPDFTVTNLTFDLPDPWIGDIVKINATIANDGAAEKMVFVELYDNKSITIERILKDYPESPNNDTITLMGVKRIRVHFESFDVSSEGSIKIYNETHLIKELTGWRMDHWTEWCDGDTIRIESCNAGFTVDRYEALLVDRNISLGAGNSTNIPAVWNLSDQSMGWAVHGSHNITVRADPYNEIVESNETNNERIKVIDVNPSLDFAVTNIFFNTTEPVLGDVVEITANISNYGVRNGTTVVGFYYDNSSIEIKRHEEKNIGDETENCTFTNNITLPPGVLGARLHFDSLHVYNSYVDICDENGRVVERFYGMKFNDPVISIWTDYMYTDNITVKIVFPYNSRMATHWCKFTIDRYEVLIADETVILNATESKIINASWPTGAAYGGARDHNITVVVDPRNHSVETNETNNTLSEQVFVNGTDLTVTAIEIPCGDDYDNYCCVGQDVNVTVTIANIGAVDATNFTVEFRDDTCSNKSGANTSSVNFNNVHIERLDSGESMNISVIWNPTEIFNHTITASIPYNKYTDNNKTNNERFVYGEVKAGYDFTVGSVNVEPQDNVRRGESVNITATIGNIGHWGENVSIAFFVNSTDYAGTCGERFIRIKTIDDVHVEINETETVSIAWDVDVAGGHHLIAAVVNPDDEVEEYEGITRLIPQSDVILFRGETGNNVKNCTLYVTPLDLNITNLALVPAEPNIGDIVNVSAEIKNNGDAEANSTMWFYMEKDETVSGTIFSLHDVRSTWSWSSELQPEAPIRYHFDYIKIRGRGSVNASVTNSVGEDRPVHFYVKCENFGGQDAKVPNIVNTTDFSTDCYEMDGNFRRWDDVWTDWTNGTAVKINATIGSKSQIMLQIDKYQVRLGNETVTLHPGESMVYNSTWNTSPPLKAGEDYTLMVNVEDETGYTNTYLRGTDLAVTNLSINPVVYDGDMVWVNATIENLGWMDATDFIVNITEVYTPISTTHPDPDIRYDIRGDDHLESIDTTHIEGLGAGNSIDISVLWNVSIRDIECEGLYNWDKTRPCPPWTEYECDDYSISVEINPLENKDKELDIANNTKKKDVDIAKSRDFIIRGPSFWVNNESRNSSELVVYDYVTLNATLDITNLANQGGVVDVGFYIDDPCDTHKIGNTTVAFPAGNGTGYAQIEWNVDSFDDVDIVGRHNMTVVADPENLIYEIDELNNATPHPIYVMASDPKVEILDIHPVNPERDETVSIEVTIANYGQVDADNVTFTIYDWAKRHIENDANQSGPGREQIVITKEDATAMRLYLDIEVENGSMVRINDASGMEIIHYDRNFHGWTPWVPDNNITIVVNETDSAYAKVSWVYYLESGSIIDTSTYDLGINETRNITVNWTPPTVGERLIAAIVDPEDRITEHDEVNNRLVKLVQVQTADLAVSNLSLAWHNGTKIEKTKIVKDGDAVIISANIANIGVEDAGSFDLRFLVDDLSIQNEVIGGLAPDRSNFVSVDWHVTVGDHLLKVEADYANEIDETNETNNIAALEWYVCGAELSGNTSWETLGLHGEILFGPDQPYDEDEVNITARITNSGYLDATDFNAALFFDYTSDDEFQKSGNTFYGETWKNRTYHGAKYVYVNVTTPVDPREGWRNIIKNDVIIYDGNGSEVARPVAGPGEPCWVRVNGNTTNVSITTQGGRLGPVFDIFFYPIYQDGTSMLFWGVDLPVNSSCNLLMKQNVNAGDHKITLFIDPENKVPEDEEYRNDNTISRIMHVKPTRDFMITNVTWEETNLSDLDTQTITAEISNIGLRNGTTDVSFVDYEVEHRTYKYHFDINRSPSYLPIPPDDDVELLKDGYDNLMIIHRPGVDAIEVHFNIITLYAAGSMGPPAGKILICDVNGSKIWHEKGQSGKYPKVVIIHDKNITVPGDTAYIYTFRPYFELDKYTTETEFHKEEVRLNATKELNESKNITSNRTAYTGNHTTTVTLDGDDKIAEINESNNELSSLFNINASRDPVFLRINITPENPVEGENVYITAFVANNGSKNASFTVDLWANLTRNKPGPDESLPKPDLTTDLGGDRIRYITLLKHEIVTLAPGNNTTVNATWNNIRIAGDPTLHIIAIIDPTDEIDEMNESNNEIVKEIIPEYPDLTIGTVYVPERGVIPVVPIKELGRVSGASGVTVRFEAYETEECSEYVHGWDDCKISHPGASNMQVYFDSLDSRKGSVIVNDRYSSKNPKKEYEGAMIAGVWSPWVEEETIWIITMGGTTKARIGEYRWGNVSDAKQFNLHAGTGKDVKIPWTEYREPYDLTITVDPDNNITELNEDNNIKTIRMGADIAFIDNVTLDPNAPIMGDTCYIQEVQNIGNLHTGEFYVTISINATDEVAFEHNTTINETISLAPNEKYSFLWKTPEVEPPDDINYDIRIVADPEDVVEELDEDNNEGSGNVTVYSHTNYTGGKLYLYDTDWVYGNINYTIGNSIYGRGWGDYVVNFEGVIPENIKEDDIKLARLYLYWTWGKAYSINESKFVPVPIEVDVKFNGGCISEDRRYLDYPHATDYDVSWGTYTYEIPSDAVKSDNSVIVDKSPFKNKYESDQYFSSPQSFGIFGVGLLVVYEDDDGVLTNYWINEGGDVIYEGASALGIEDMATTAAFKGKVEDEDIANATLWTIVSGSFNDENELHFNGVIWEDVWDANIAVDHRCVTKNLIAKDNKAELQYISGTSMMSSGAFLFVRYPPDLAVTDIDTPVSAVVGNKYAINTTISNEGRSDATDFNVSFYSNKVRIGRQKISGLDSGDNITLQFNWKPMHLGKIYKIKVAADVVSGQDWIEPDTDNNEMTKKVPIVGSGYGNESGPIGEGGAGTGGTGEGGEGSVSLFDTITGILMKGSILDDGKGGGGGIGEFSLLEWIMKSFILAICSMLIFFGFLMEKRRHNMR